MNEKEYKYIQDRLLKKICDIPYYEYIGSERNRGYKQGILAAKSILSEIYHGNYFSALEEKKNEL